MAAAGGGLITAAALPAHADTARIREFKVPNPDSSPSDITVGADGNLWFTESNANNIARMTPSGVITEFATSAPTTGITTGADGNVWFLEDNIGVVAKITPSGQITEFPPTGCPFYGSLFGGITKGPDGNVWYTDVSCTGLSKITPSGQVTDFTVPTSVFTFPSVITAGPDGNLWFGLQREPLIGRISPSGTNYVEFSLPPAGPILASQVNGITAGPDGNIWYTNYNNKIGRMTPTGVATEFSVPTSGPFLQDITTGSDGNLWFTEFNTNRVGRATPTGKISEFLLPHPFSGPQGIVGGPGGRVWFAENGITGGIGSIDPATVTPPPGPCLVLTRSITLSHDIGPCAGDGIVVTANNVTVDLNGHKVFAAPGRRVGDFAGIHLVGASRDTVKNGEVTGFDAGVFVDRGSANTLTHLNVHDNLGAPDPASFLGDGIVLMHSSDNTIAGNTVTHNGNFDGIGVLGLGSNNNTIRDNAVQRNTDLGTANFGSGSGIIVDAFLEVEDPNRGQSLRGTTSSPTWSRTTWPPASPASPTTGVTSWATG